jgi:hypothetical protein
MIGFFRQALALLGLARKQPATAPSMETLKIGGLYSVYDGDERRTFGVVKILVLESDAVHLRVYHNTFAMRPQSIDPATLTLGSLDLNALDDVDLDNYKFGIGHMPLALKDFLYGWQPLLLMTLAVTDEELEGYRYWKEAGGGVFGGLG